MPFRTEMKEDLPLADGPMRPTHAFLVHVEVEPI